MDDTHIYKYIYFFFLSLKTVFHNIWFYARPSSIRRLTCDLGGGPSWIWHLYRFFMASECISPSSSRRIYFPFVRTFIKTYSLPSIKYVFPGWYRDSSFSNFDMVSCSGVFCSTSLASFPSAPLLFFFEWPLTLSIKLCPLFKEMSFLSSLLSGDLCRLKPPLRGEIYTSNICI